MSKPIKTKTRKYTFTDKQRTKNEETSERQCWESTPEKVKNNCRYVPKRALAQPSRNQSQRDLPHPEKYMKSMIRQDSQNIFGIIFKLYFHFCLIFFYEISSG